MKQEIVGSVEKQSTEHVILIKQDIRMTEKIHGGGIQKD